MRQSVPREFCEYNHDDFVPSHPSRNSSVLGSVAAGGACRSLLPPHTYALQCVFPRMYAETTEKKMSSARVAFALLCGLAVCCSVMYVTADGADEYMHEVVTGKQGLAGSVSVDAGTSVGSTDVLKAGQVYTETPDGRMRLMDYFNNVEAEIADEVANRKSDIAAVRAQMARDFAFNSAARAKLQKDMLHKMAVNAKQARDDLNKAMRKTQERMAKQASLANRRYKATLKRDKKTDTIISNDKKRAAHALKLAVSAWQKSTSAWGSATNARIDRLNEHVAANAAQIKENAKKARKDLEVAMNDWDHKVATFRETSATARSKLSEQFKQQDKATRAWANNKIKGLVAGTAAQFNDIETKMSQNRHEVDMALRQAPCVSRLPSMLPRLSRISASPQMLPTLLPPSARLKSRLPRLRPSSRSLSSPSLPP